MAMYLQEQKGHALSQLHTHLVTKSRSNEGGVGVSTSLQMQRETGGILEQIKSWIKVTWMQ